MTGTILVVDDSTDNIGLVDYVLRHHGYEPLLATTGAEGLRLAMESRPDVLLLDIRMADMNGYEVATAVRSRPELADMKIVAVTASAMVGDREHITSAGFDGYIQKPIDLETFIDQVEAFLPETRRAPMDEI